MPIIFYSYLAMYCIAYALIFMGTLLKKPCPTSFRYHDMKCARMHMSLAWSLPQFLSNIRLTNYIQEETKMVSQICT